MTRKERSEEILERHNIIIDPHLPEIEPTSDIKTPEEIVRRAVTAFFAANIAIDICENGTPDRTAGAFADHISKLGLEDGCTADEKPYLAQIRPNAPHIDGDSAADFSWRIERCTPLFWACGFKEHWTYPLAETNIDEIIEIIMSYDSFGELMSRVKMRSDGGILDHADLLYRMYRACVEAELRGKPEYRGDLDPDVIAEQHKGYNWLIGTNEADDWDNIDLCTNR